MRYGRGVPIPSFPVTMRSERNFPVLLVMAVILVIGLTTFLVWLLSKNQGKIKSLTEKVKSSAKSLLDCETSHPRDSNGNAVTQEMYDNLLNKPCFAETQDECPVPSCFAKTSGDCPISECFAKRETDCPVKECPKQTQTQCPPAIVDNEGNEVDQAAYDDLFASKAVYPTEGQDVLGSTQEFAPVGQRLEQMLTNANIRQGGGEMEFVVKRSAGDEFLFSTNCNPETDQCVNEAQPELGCTQFAKDFNFSTGDSLLDSILKQNQACYRNACTDGICDVATVAGEEPPAGEVISLDGAEGEEEINQMVQCVKLDSVKLPGGTWESEQSYEYNGKCLQMKKGFRCAGNFESCQKTPWKFEEILDEVLPGLCSVIAEKTDCNCKFWRDRDPTSSRCAKECSGCALTD